MGIIVWFSLFKFNWLRRCRICGVRGSKCLCRRPSLALEHIFFLEERKNRFGARNFSHVSDTMMTYSSTVMTTSSSTTSTHSTNGADASSTFRGATVVMRGAGSFINSEVNPTDYYYPSMPLPSNASDSSGELLTPRGGMDSKTETQLCANGRRDPKQCRSAKVSAATDVSSAATTTTLVNKGSRHVMSKARHNRDKNMIAEVKTGEYILYTAEDIPVAEPHRQQQIVSSDWRQLRTQNMSAKAAITRAQHKGERGVSFQFYGRSGNSIPASPVPTLMLPTRSMSSRSANDSFMINSSSILSVHSERASLEANFGSLNPQSNLSNTGRLIESGCAPSIKEIEEAQALKKLTGWFHASSVSTQDSFMLSQ